MKKQKTVTQKVQALITEDEFVNLNRLVFWDQTKGNKNGTLSSYIRYLIKKELASRPEEDYKPINYKEWK